MATLESYHPGGYKKTGPQQGRSELWDSATGLATRWDADGVQVEQRQLTADELAALTAQDAEVTVAGNREQLRQQAAGALDTNRAYLELSTPTAAQSAAQVKALTRQASALIRLAVGKLDKVEP